MNQVHPQYVPLVWNTNGPSASSPCRWSRRPLPGAPRPAGCRLHVGARRGAGVPGCRYVRVQVPLCRDNLVW